MYQSNVGFFQGTDRLLTEGILRKCPAQRSSTITELLAEFVARDLRPLSVVEVKGFEKLIEDLDSSYGGPYTLT